MAIITQNNKFGDRFVCRDGSEAVFVEYVETNGRAGRTHVKMLLQEVRYDGLRNVVGIINFYPDGRCMDSQTQWDIIKQVETFNV